MGTAVLRYGQQGGCSLKWRCLVRIFIRHSMLLKHRVHLQNIPYLSSGLFVRLQNSKVPGSHFKVWP